MGTKSDFVTALGGATVVIGTAKTVTPDNTSNELGITAHGKVTGDGPIRITSTGQLPTGLAPFKATNGLTHTPGAIADDVVEVNDVFYAWAADPTTGTPDGTVGTPYLVDVGGDDETSLANLLAAINASGTPGVTYSEEIVAAHATVEAVTSDATTVTLRARSAGLAGNAFTLSVTGTDGVAADAALFTGGLDPVDYFAIFVDANTIQVALTPTGTAVTFTDDGSGTITTGGTAQGVADALEEFLVSRLTAPGNRVQLASENISRTWDQLIAALI
jgi:hypothetical protein